MIRERGLKPFTAGLLALIIIVVVSFFGFTKSNPFSSPHEIKAAFRTAADVDAGSPVRIAGVEAGEVTKVERLAPDENETGAEGSIVTMEIDKSALPIHKDATAKVRPRIFLEGNFFVDLTAGSPSAAPLDDGDTIPVQQTAAPVQFGEILSALQSDTREDLQVALHEYGRAINREGGRAFNRTIPWWKPAYRDGAAVGDAMLGRRDGDLAGYVRHMGRVSEALDRNSEQLKNLITDFATTAGAFAEEEQNLEAAIGELPTTLRVGESALGELNDAFPPLRRFTADLRPAVRSSEPMLDTGVPWVRQMRRLVSEDELKGLVRDLRPLVPNLVGINRRGVPFQQQSRLLSSCNNEVIHDWTEDRITTSEFEAQGPVYQEGVKWLPGIAAESRSFDANGQYIKTLAKGPNSTMTMPDGRIFLFGEPPQGVNPPPASQPPFRPDVPCETQEPPDLRSNPQAPPRTTPLELRGPAALEAFEQARDRAVEWMREQIEETGLSGELSVADDLLTSEQLGQLGRVTPSLPGGGAPGTPGDAPEVLSNREGDSKDGNSGDSGDGGAKDEKAGGDE